jgi:hypothetical protein
LADAKASRSRGASLLLVPIAATPVTGMPPAHSAAAHSIVQASGGIAAPWSTTAGLPLTVFQNGTDTAIQILLSICNDSPSTTVNVTLSNDTTRKPVVSPTSCQNMLEPLAAASVITLTSPQAASGTIQIVKD